MIKKAQKMLRFFPQGRHPQDVENAHYCIVFWRNHYGTTLYASMADRHSENAG